MELLQDWLLMGSTFDGGRQMVYTQEASGGLIFPAC